MPRDRDCENCQIHTTSSQSEAATYRRAADPNEFLACPTGAITAEDNYVDLVWHELEFREGYSFADVVRHHDGRYLGCCYLHPMGRRVSLTEELMRHDVDVSWWVTSEAYERGYHAKLYEALTQWVCVGSCPR